MKKRTLILVASVLVATGIATLQYADAQTKQTWSEAEIISIENDLDNFIFSFTERIQRVSATNLDVVGIGKDGITTVPFTNFKKSWSDDRKSLTITGLNNDKGRQLSAADFHLVVDKGTFRDQNNRLIQAGVYLVQNFAQPPDAIESLNSTLIVQKLELNQNEINDNEKLLKDIQEKLNQLELLCNSMGG